MKNKILKSFLILIMFMSSLFLVSCNKKSDDSSSSDSDYTGADTSATYSSITSATNTISSSLSSNETNTTLPSDPTTGKYEIKEAGSYYFTGSLTEAIVVKKESGNVHIYLDNATLSVTSLNAIESKKESYVVITLIGTNTLSNTGEEKHVIDSKENLVINGSGSLTINSTKSAIACDKTFYGLGGTINVTAVNHAITADSIYIDGLTLNATSVGKDILHAESDYDEVDSAPTFSYSNGFVFVNSGSINSTTVYGDGISADSYIYIKGGTFIIKTTYLSSNADESTKGIKAGTIDYAFESNPDNELEVSSNNYTVLIEGGTFSINTYDDAIHANSGSVLIYGGTFTINTSDDAIHADNNLKINGSASINVKSCYEGLEATTIDILGGSTTILASDDGVNAANSSLDENTQKTTCVLTISGGRLDVTVNPNGDRDGIDSNGSIVMTGGVVITRGPNSQNASPLDAANSISVTGGTLIVIGNTPNSGGDYYSRGGRGGGAMGGGMGGGMSEYTFSSSLTRTQTSSKGLTKGDHEVVISGTTISYNNAYKYTGYTTVYSSSSASIS